MESAYTSNSKIRGKFISLADFSSCVHRFSLRFKDGFLEREYPTKSIRPFNITVLLKILLYILVIFIGLRRLEMMLLAFINHRLLHGIVKEEIINFSVFAVVVIVEAAIYFYRPFKVVRGLFFMSYVYISTAFASYYNDNGNLFSVTMYLLLSLLGASPSTCAPSSLG